MASHAPKVSGLLPPPCQNDCRKAISLALLAIRAQGWGLVDLGKELGCSDETISNASNEKTTLSFESIALLAHKFPDQFAKIESLWNLGAAAPVTALDRLDRIERDTTALRKELGA